jgi:hypothetical protein
VGPTFGNFDDYEFSSALFVAMEDRLTGAAGVQGGTFVMGTSTYWVCGLACYLAGSPGCRVINGPQLGNDMVFKGIALGR